MNNGDVSNFNKSSDNASNSLQRANQVGQFAKDSNVASLNNKLGSKARRNNESSLSKTPITNFSNNYKTSNTFDNSNNTVNQQAKNRLERRNKNINRFANVAEKAPIPMVQAAAKTAKASKIIQQSKQKKGGFLKNLLGGFGGNDEHPSQAEQDAALTADARGEEYEENQTVGSAFIKMDKKTKFLLVGIVSGSLFALIFTCIFVMSAITTSAGEAYLASHDNPTTDELETQYNAQDSNDISANNSDEAYLNYNEEVTEFVAQSVNYNPEDLSDYFGTKRACTKDGSENDCRNGDEYKFYLKMYDMYYLYKNKYNVTLDLPLIMATLYYNNEQLPVVFSNNLNNYNRDAVKDTNQLTNLDWEYDYKNISGYQYLDADNFNYDMQILAKNMVTKTITYKCPDGSSNKATDIEKSNYSNKTLPCASGSYDPSSINESYTLDTDKYDKFLLEYIKLKYHTKGSGRKYSDDGNYVGDIEFMNGNFGKIYYFNQLDYADSPYGSYGTIATHGCGPTALSIVISSILNEQHNPVEITNYVCNNGGCSNDGTYHDAITSTAQHYGLKVNKTGDKQAVINALSGGKSLVIAIMCPGHFTTSGHFITLTGSSNNGKVTVADPASRDRSTDWDFNTVAEETCDAGGAPYWIMSK